MTDPDTLSERRARLSPSKQALLGMKQGGYRKVRVSPHLAYREQGHADLIPPDAVLILELWMRELIRR